MKPLGRGAALATAAAAVVGCAVVGSANGPLRPGRALWYAALRKPRRTPPGPAVGATWSLLEVLLAAAGYRLLRAPGSRSRDAALAGWTLTLGGLAGFPWLFFRERRLGAATAASAAMLASTTLAVTAGARSDPPASIMLVPVAAWLAFATLLGRRLRTLNAWASAD